MKSTVAIKKKEIIELRRLKLKRDKKRHYNLMHLSHREKELFAQFRIRSLVRGRGYLSLQKVSILYSTMESIFVRC